MSELWLFEVGPKYKLHFSAILSECAPSSHLLPFTSPFLLLFHLHLEKSYPTFKAYLKFNLVPNPISDLPNRIWLLSLICFSYSIYHGLPYVILYLCSVIIHSWELLGVRTIYPSSDLMKVFNTVPCTLRSSYFFNCFVEKYLMWLHFTHD